MSAPCESAPNGTWTCTLKRPGGYQPLAIWNSTTTTTYVPSKQYNQYQDLAGNVMPVNGPINIGENPILLENSQRPLNRTIRKLTEDKSLRWLLKFLAFS